MRLIRGKDTKPEIALFEILERGGVPFEPHARVCGVSVDAVVAGNVLVFVDSPFWHLRDPADLDRLSDYWRMRLLRNRRRDRRQVRRLRAEGYTVLRIWADELGEARVRQRVRSAVSRAAGRRNKETCAHG